MAQDRIITEIAGTIASANERGVKLVNGTEWINFSKFSDGLVPPPTGAVVTLGLDKAGYIRTIASAEPERGMVRVAPTIEAPTGCPSKDQQICRMNAVTNAVTICATNGTVEVADVLAVAEQLERWVNRCL